MKITLICNYLHVIRSVYREKLLKNDSGIIKFTPALRVSTKTSRVSSVVWCYRFQSGLKVWNSKLGLIFQHKQVSAF